MTSGRPRVAAATRPRCCRRRFRWRAGLASTTALLTCDVDNEASRRVILSAGGVLEDQRDGKLRFWVPTG